ncbi:protein MODIFIER OF SNC1 1 [Pyrus x bretschneideri]|uniref:protein MODIFIER OF SNC1 1 n=1 Tax=Pyrus x bretschneideri TaxID=225117 RepID=UPI00202E257B|nr:protein MODIFIER OF SNC1 1 [Pyrus x bretschneideri]
MTSSMLFGDRRTTSSRRSGMTVLGKVPKPVNLPSKRLENHGADPSVEIVPKGTLSWGSRSSSASNAWGSSSLSPKADGGTSPSHLSGHLSPGSGTRPSTAGSDKGHEPSSNAWGSNSRPSSASGALTSNQTTLTSLRPRSADTRPGSSQLSRFAEHSDHPVAWSAPGTAEKLGMMSSKNDGFSLTSGDFPTLGSEKDNPGKSAEPQDHSSYSRPGSSSGRVAKETTGTYVVGEISENANMKGGTANSWKRENPLYNEDGGRHGMEKWQGNPHPYPSANVPPQHYDGWHGGPVNNPQGGVWYRGPPGAPYGAPIPPGGFPMEPFPYYPPGPPQIPPAAIASQQSIPPPGAGPRGHHPKNGDMYRPHMQDAYIRPGMPIRPGFYPGPVAFEGYYNSPRGYCNPNERDVPYVGMTAGPPVYNNYPSQSAHRPAISQGRPSGYGPPNPKLMSEQFESAHPPDSLGPYKVLLKQHDGWDRRNEEQRNEGAVTGLSTDASSLEREDHPSTLGAERDWISDHRKEGVRDQRKMVGEEAASRKFDNQGAASVPKKVMSPESLEQIKTVDVISMKKSGTEAYGTPEVAQPLLDAAKDSSLIQKIEGLNAKARVSDGRSDTSSVSTREEQKNRFQVNAKAHNSVNEPVGGGIVNPERSHATESINPSLEVGSTISISRQSNRAMHDNRSDHRGRGRFNNQEGEGWSKKSLVSEPTTVVSTARFEMPYDHLVSTEAIEKSGSYPQGRCEEELAMPMVDPNDSEAQRAKMRELAKQRTKQLQEEEEERTRRQMAKARAKLEELNRRTQVESSNQKIESHSSGAIQIKQEGSQTAGEPLSGGRKSALGSNLDGASLINESSTGKAEKSTVLASDLPSDTLKSVCKEPVLMHDESMPKLKEVIVANVVDQNNAPQAHEINITRVKQAPKQRQNNQLEKKPTGKFTSTSTDDATKCQTDSLVDVSKSLGVVPNETASSSESSQTANPSVILESTSHPRKKNNRIGKNKQKTESTSTAAAMPSSASKETDIANATVESGRPRVSELELDPSSGQSQTIPRDAYHSSAQHLSPSNEESKGKGNSQWKPQHFRRVSRNSQAIKHSEKFHSTDAVVWAPVRSQNKADVPDEAIPNNEVEAVSAVKTEHKVQNSSKNKRAEMERYVPKPVAKEMAHQGSTQQPVASVINQTAINETIERSDSGSQVAESSQPITLTIGKVGIAIEPRHGSSRQSKHGKAHGSWKGRGSTESTAMHGSEDGPSYASNVDKNSVQNHQPQKPDVVSEIEQPKSYDWNDSDGWNMPEEPVAVAPVSVSAKDQGNTRRGKQHPFKGHRAMGNNHDLDEKNNSRGDTYKNNNQFSASETGQTDLGAASRENRAVGERAAPHWQPKSQAHSGNSQLGNRASGGQNVVVEVGRTVKKETSPRGAVPRPATPDKDNTEYVAQYQHDQVISERNNAGEGHSKRERKASFRGRPRSPNQGHVTPVETAPVSMDTRQEQHFNTGFRKNGNQNSRFGRGQESRGDWNYSGHDSRQHNHPANRERQRHSPHFEYQPVGSYNSNNKFNNSEEPRDGSYNTGGRVKERGQTHPRRGGGNLHGRQSGASQVDADMEQ